ncbi:hypothetical protein [uncultured Duncaniella sp.]|nr:hypothetical protein [uncultured Duncaniella sp.]
MEGNKKDGGGKDRMWNQNDFKTVAYSATGRLSKLIFMGHKKQPCNPPPSSLPFRLRSIATNG